MGRLAGKTAFISGTGAGIRRAAAEIFTAEGALVFGCDIETAAAAETVEIVEKAGGVMRSLAPVDLSTEEGARVGAPPTPGPFETMPAEDWYFTIRNEPDIPYFCTRAAWPHLIARGGGAVLDVASVAAVRGAPFMPMVPHGAAKGASSP